MKSNAGILWEKTLFYVVAGILLLLGIALFSTRSPSVPDESAPPPAHAPAR